VVRFKRDNEFLISKIQVMITIIAGTNRPGSNSLKIAEFLKAVYAKMDQPAEVLSLKDLPESLFRPEAYAEKPEAFKPFADAVLNSSGLHVVSPEYNGGYPGVLKYFIDMLPFPESFEGKPVAFTGVAAGQFGALRPVEQLQQIFGYRNAYIYPNRVFIMGVFGLINESDILEDAKTEERLIDQASGFAEFVKTVG
jgi:NAD(P)H-dependent FMN reductase